MQIIIKVLKGQDCTLDVCIVIAYFMTPLKN